MDAIERATRWFFAGRKAWVLWPVGIMAVTLAGTAVGAIGQLAAGVFLIVVPVAWVAGLLGIAARDHLSRPCTRERLLLSELWSPVLWAGLYVLPILLISNWTVALLWWLVVAYVEKERRFRAAQQSASNTSG
jgi:hypothetical protein